MHAQECIARNSTRSVFHEIPEHSKWKQILIVSFLRGDDDEIRLELYGLLWYFGLFIFHTLEK